jgi:hypothetical protein
MAQTTNYILKVYLEIESLVGILLITNPLQS